MLTSWGLTGVALGFVPTVEPDPSKPPFVGPLDDPAAVLDPVVVELAVFDELDGELLEQF
jgi:hypothetical protein